MSTWLDWLRLRNPYTPPPLDSHFKEVRLTEHNKASCPGSPTECSSNGICYAPEPLGSQKPYCQCRSGWGGADCSFPECPNNCTDATHGSCNTQSNTPKCICKPGYQLGCELDCSVRIPVCPGNPKQCSGNGNCINSICSCRTGWTGADCSLAVCSSKTPRLRFLMSNIPLRWLQPSW